MFNTNKEYNIHRIVNEFDRIFLRNRLKIIYNGYKRGLDWQKTLDISVIYSDNKKIRLFVTLFDESLNLTHNCYLFKITLDFDPIPGTNDIEFKQAFDQAKKVFEQRVTLPQAVQIPDKIKQQVNQDILQDQKYQDGITRLKDYLDQIPIGINLDHKQWPGHRQALLKLIRDI